MSMRLFDHVRVSIYMKPTIILSRRKCQDMCLLYEL
jgi:hypothetical protein